MPNLTEEKVEKVKDALRAAGRNDLAQRFVFPMTDMHPCWPALNALEYRTDQLSREASYIISWNMLGLS